MKDNIEIGHLSKFEKREQKRSSVLELPIDTWWGKEDGGGGWGAGVVYV